MNKDNKIEELKEMYKDNERFDKNGTIYHRFVLAEAEVPEKLKDEKGRNPYLTIIHREGKAYMVLTKSIGITEEEKLRRQKEKQEKAALRIAKMQKRREKQKEILQVKKKIKNLASEMKFDDCKKEKEELDILEQEYKENYGRKRKD